MAIRRNPDGTEEEVTLEEMQRELENAQIVSVQRGTTDLVTGEWHRDLFWERMGARSGDPEAMMQMAQAYLNGDGVEQDNAKAVEYMRMAAEEDLPEAQYNLALFYCQGDGVERSFAQARYWMERAEENGDEDAPGILAELEKAEKFEAAAKAGDVQAKAELASILMQFRSEENLRECVAYAREAAEAGNALGMYTLALAYEHGRGVEESAGDAFAWYRQAAELGYAPAMTNLGCLYGRGDGTEQDEELAMVWIRKAAAKGDKDAKRILAQMGEDEEPADFLDGQTPDEIRAAMESGDEEAAISYALACLAQQPGIPDGPETGVELLEQLCETSADACMALAACYENGVGLEADIWKAIGAYEKAHALDPENTEIQHQLALALLTPGEQGDREALERSLRYFKMAADGGDDMCAKQYLLWTTVASQNDGLIPSDFDLGDFFSSLMEKAQNGDEEAMGLVSRLL